MPSCVAVDGSGFVYETTEIYPDCADFALVGVGHLDRLTYWADVAIALDPAGTELYELMGACLLIFAIAWGIKQIARLILNR